MRAVLKSPQKDFVPYDFILGNFKILSSEVVNEIMMNRNSIEYSIIFKKIQNK